MEGFEAWYLQTHRRVISLVLVACDDVDVAADSADEAFARALDRWGRVESMRSPEAWVCRVALNVMRRRMRRRTLEQRLVGRQPPRGGADEPIVHPELWAAIRRLPERQRLAVLLRYVADLSEADIADAMGIARGTVSSSLAAARASLAGVLTDRADLEVPRA